MHQMKNIGIMKIAITGVVLGSAALLPISEVRAAPLISPFSVAIGGNFLQSNTARNNFNDYGLHVGLGYTLPGLGITSGTPSIDADYDYNSGHGNTVNTYALFITDRYYITKLITAGTFSPYFGAGVGGAVLNGSGDIGSGNATNFAGKFLIGAKFSQAFVELAYQLNGKIDGYDDTNFNLTVGTHF